MGEWILVLSLINAHKDIGSLVTIAKFEEDPPHAVIHI